MRVNSANVQYEGLRIGGIRRRMNSKVKISQTRHVSRINMVVNLAYSQSVPGRPLLAPIYIYVARSQGTGRVQYILQCPYTTLTRILTMTIIGPNLMGLRGTQITGSISYTLVSSPRDSTRIVDSSWISNLYIFDLINLRLLLFPVFN
jgi:hypothetical protein